MDGDCPVDALLFDVFGTVVDWRSSVVAEGVALGQAYGLDVNWPALADQWRRQGYLAPIARMVAGEQPWAPIDAVLRSHLGRLAPAFGLVSVGQEALDRLATAWERLAPWPDSVEGLGRLRSRYLVAPLSNGTFAQLARLAHHAGLPWDCVIATELLGTYKPDPEAYLGAARLLDLPPSRVMLVAAHPPDLEAAARCGLRTALVLRPLEWGRGPIQLEEPAPPTGFDLVASDFLALAEALGA